MTVFGNKIRQDPNNNPEPQDPKNDQSIMEKIAKFKDTRQKMTNLILENALKEKGNLSESKDYTESEHESFRLETTPMIYQDET